MTRALSAGTWDSSAHPRNPGGQTGGGEFADGSSGSKQKAQPRQRQHIAIPKGHLGFDGTRGTGYGTPGGDARVKKLQADLNRLGLVDAHGKKLALDGKLGPLTTQAIKAAQERLGMKPTGIVTEGFIARLGGTRELPKVSKKAPVKAAAAHALTGVELARPGAWKVASGNGNFTAEMLRDAADFFAASGGQVVPVKLGHADPRFDGSPAFDGDPAWGSVTNLRYEEDDRGPVLLGDITGMPEWLAASAPRHWPNRSVEGWQDVTFDGRTYALVLTGLAFLGATPPAVRNIKSLADLQTALAASSAVRLAASAPVDDQAAPPQSLAPAAEPPTKGAGMSLAKYREALAGLPDDASEDDVRAALTAAGLSSPTPPEPAPAPAAAEPVAAAAGTMLVASSVWEEQQNTIKRLTAFVDKAGRDERDQVIAEAVKDGKFTPAQKPHFAKLWDADPKGTRTVIDSLTRNSALAVMASGYTDNGGLIEDDELDREIARLSRPSQHRSVGRG